MKAEINLEIGEDGTVTWKTGRIPDEHHDDADALQAELEKLLGGEVQRTQKAGKAHVHTHADGTVHEHMHE
jgi:hypothetical protein